MKSSTGQAFEVRCPGCGVSFPVGTKSCLHCGSRIGRRAASPAQVQAAPASLTPEGNPMEEARPAKSEPDLPAWLGGREDTAGEQDVENERPRWLRWGSNVVWVLIAIAATLSQMCGRG